MSLSTDDREFIVGRTTPAPTPLLIMLILFIIQWMIVGHIWGQKSYHTATSSRLDDLCRAHYPECVVEQRER